MEGGDAGGTEAEMSPTGRGNASAGATLLDEMLHALLADEPRIRSSGYSINSSVSLSVTARCIEPPSLMCHDSRVQWSLKFLA